VTHEERRAVPTRSNLWILKCGQSAENWVPLGFARDKLDFFCREGVYPSVARKRVRKRMKLKEINGVSWDDDGE
jgi:hypothetical protein